MEYQNNIRQHFSNFIRYFCTFSNVYFYLSLLPKQQNLQINQKLSAANYLRVAYWNPKRMFVFFFLHNQKQIEAIIEYKIENYITDYYNGEISLYLPSEQIQSI